MLPLKAVNIKKTLHAIKWQLAMATKILGSLLSCSHTKIIDGTWDASRVPQFRRLWLQQL